MDSQKKLDYNKKLKDRYNSDEDYRERKKQIAINHYYRKKYPKFTSIVSAPAFKNYINWAIQETDNVFKDKPQKSKIQKESLIKLLEKLNRKL